MFIVSFVVVTVKARLIGFDRHLEEAAMDLGANELTTFRKVTLPLIAPAMLAAALLGFALSIDDFVITYFNAGRDADVPRLRLGHRARRGAAAGERRRERDLPRRDRDRPRQRLLAVPQRRQATTRSRMTTTAPTRTSTSSRPRRSTSGCTSPAWAGTRPRTSRSSSAATAATSRTRTGSATWTRSPGSSR